jgi:hypothetical protein
MMSISAARIGAVIRKELTEIRRSRFIVSTMVIIPLIFLIAPTTTLTQNPSAPSAGLDKGMSFLLLYLLVIPVVIPSTIAAYSVVRVAKLFDRERLVTGNKPSSGMTAAQ